MHRLAEYLRSDPNNPHLLRDHFQEAYAAQEWLAAKVSLETLRTTEAFGPEDAIALATVTLHNGSLAGAIEVLEQCRLQWSDRQDLDVALAKYLLYARAYESALELLQGEFDDAELTKSVEVMQIRCLHGLGRIDEAEAAVDKFRADGRQDEQFSTVAIPVLVDASRLDDAASLASGLPAAGDGAYPSYEVYAIQSLQQGATADSLGWTAKALEVRSNDGRIWLIHGSANLASGHGAEALQAFENAVSYMPGHPGSHVAQGWAHLFQGAQDKAAQCFSQAIAVGPTFSEAHGSAAVSSAMKGAREEAVTLIRTALRLDRMCASARYAQALLDGTAQADIHAMAQQYLSSLQNGNKP